MSKLDYNYHTHTSRCGHAVGDDEEYVKAAIESGFSEYGVSDHVFLPGIIHENMRGDYSLLNDYIKSFKQLRENYKDRINIKIGFEAEYMDQFKTYYKSLLEKHKVDYLILGQHCYYKDKNVYWYVTMDPKEGLIKYTEDVIKGMSTGLFKYVAHPDLFSLFYDEWDELAISCSKRIIDASIEYKCPLEINLCKVRSEKLGTLEHDYKSLYPFIPFWKLVAKSKAHIVIGIDSHDPQHNINSEVEYVDKLIEETGIKVDFNYRIK